MAKTYKRTLGRRVGNMLVSGLLRLGLTPGLGNSYLMTVRGRRSGHSYTTPVTLIQRDGQRWLVSPYGEVSWVRNARAAGQVTLSRGRQSETVGVSEVGPEESASVLREYVTHIPIVRPYFDVAPDASLDAFTSEAPRHPVFRIGPATPRASY